jgi:NADP-dependent 3-hydroxy acid dehydrogenase YdfG
MLAANGRVIMISGANRGIGLATARVLAARGFRLSLGARDPDTIDKAGFDSDLHVVRWDATEPETSKAWAAEVQQNFGQIDGVVLNAGVAIAGKLEDDDEAAYDTMWEVNFKGPLRLTRAVLPALRTSGHGRVINIVSLSGKRLMSASMLGYSASKFAALALTHAIRHDGWSDGIRATAICPGLVETRMVADVEPPEGQFKIAPDTIAETVAYALNLPNEAVVAEILVNSRLEASF